MTKEQWALILSLISMLLVASSYFFKKKSAYLLMQATGMLLLMGSYLLNGEFFAMVGLGIGLGRALTFFLFEQNNKKPSVFWPILFSSLSIMAYVVINLIILKDARLYDILYLIGLILYAFVFWIRNLQLMRHLAILHTSISILYNTLIDAGIFVVIAYSLEMFANLISVVKYHLFDKKKKNEVQEDEKCASSENSSVDIIG